MTRADRTPNDAGFTLLEVVVSLVIIGIVMTAMVTFYVATNTTLGAQRDRQAAVQLADDAMELVRAKGTAVIGGRVSGSTMPVVSGVDVNGMNELDKASGTPVVPLQVARGPIAGVTYQQYAYVGTCFESATHNGGVGCTKTGGDIEFYRVVVALTWPDAHCANRTCSYVTATLISCGTWSSTSPCVASEPVFRVGS